MRHKQIRYLSQSLGVLLLALSALMVTQSPCWALGSNATSFTYTGSQSGFTTGTVYTLSTDNQNLGFCQLTPDSSKDTGYSAQCFTNYGNTDTASYSAVTYLGSTNNPNNFFVVGDSNGNLYLTQLNYELSNGIYVVPGLTMTANAQGCPSGGQVSSLAVDPNGSYLYVGCSSTIAQKTSYSSLYSLPTYLLYSVPINTDGTLGAFEAVTGLFNVFSSSSAYTAGIWSGVSPVMRAYPPNSANLASSQYSASGAVMVSGLVGGLSDNNTAKHAPGPVPASSGVICSNGKCQVAYSFSQAGSSSFSVYTAAEAGVDYYNGSYNPALYWNQVQGNWVCIEFGPESDCFGYGSSIPWNKTSNTIYSCNIANNPIGNPAGNCGTGSYALAWTPSGMPSAGSGLQVDVSNLLYTPAPSSVSTVFTKGLLTIGTWSNGYLAYHSPATQNNSTAMFMSGNGNSGQVGNVNSLLNDVNGNLMYETNTSGLFVFNPFAGSNIANGNDITLIPNSVDSSNSSGEGLAHQILVGVEIAYYTVATIAKIAVLASDESPLDSLSTIASNDYSGFHPGLALEKALGQEGFHGQFLYTEAQLRGMGLEKGAIIRGVRLRSSQGITPNPEFSAFFKSFKLALSEWKFKQTSDELSLSFLKNIGKYRKTLTNGSLTLAKGSFPANIIYPGGLEDGKFSKPIWFDRPYTYRGGNLLMDISHSGQRVIKQFLIDALGTAGQQGIYKPLTQGGKLRGIRAVPVVEFIY